MLRTNERLSPIRTLRGWAIHMLKEAAAIQECEEHGWAKDRAEHAFDIARQHPPPGGRS